MKSLGLLPLLILVGCGGGGSGGFRGGRIVRLATAGEVRGVTGVSNDGRTVVGDVNPVDIIVSGGYWEGAASFASAPSTVEYRFGHLAAVSGDGRRFLGGTGDFGSPLLLAAKGGGVVALPLPVGVAGAYGIGLSDDGSVALATDDPRHGRPLVVRGGVASFLPLPEGVTEGFASAISGDGRVVVGSVAGRAVRWVGDSLPEPLLPDATGGSGVAAVSRDGSVVVGNIGSGFLSVPFRWERATGAVTIPVAPAFQTVTAVGLSADGKRALIRASNPGTDVAAAYLWRASTGAVLVARAAGLADRAFPGYVHQMRISGNGRVIAGFGGPKYDSANTFYAFKVILP